MHLDIAQSLLTTIVVEIRLHVALFGQNRIHDDLPTYSFLGEAEWGQIKEAEDLQKQ